jgi:hypothetical protein
MKKLLFSVVCLFAMMSCSKTELYDPDNQFVQEAAKTNAEKVLGFEVSPSQDWCSTVSGQVNITADATVKRVQLLVDVLEIDDETTPSYVTRNAMKVLNQAETNGQTSLTLYYDAPKDNLGLYVGFVTDDSYILRKVENGQASIEEKALTRGEKLTTGYTLPDDVSSFKIAGSTVSWAKQRYQDNGSFYDDAPLYYLNDYDGLNLAPGADYSADFKSFFRQFVLSYLPNGRANDNSSIVLKSGSTNANCYVTTNGEEPVILTPMYKCDHPTEYGFEVFNSELYYYYYKDEEVTGDFKTFVHNLPKYQAIPFNKAFGETEDDVVAKHGSFLLLYFGPNGTEQIGKSAVSSIFPAGYKIGFMIKANTEADGGKKQGEIYGDGRLNNEINNWKDGNFKSSVNASHQSLKTDGPRLFWIGFNNRVFMTWESGTDADFNDVIIEMEGGKVIPDIPEPDLHVFTYCFEDTKTDSDYDMNDVVIKAVRTNETTIDYYLVACGAHDDVYVRGLNIGDIKDDAEVHDLFKVSDHKTFINTDGSSYPYVSATRTVSKDFSLLDEVQQPYIYDATTHEEVRLAKTGQNPWAILIPTDFKYPSERISVTKAYPQFNSWGEGSILSNLWYNRPDKSKVR